MLTNYVNSLLDFVYQKGCSDLHLGAKQKPCVRLHGDLLFLDGKEITDEDIISIGQTYVEHAFDETISSNSYDFSFIYKDVRFRCNIFHSMNGYNAALRQLKLFSTDFNVLGLPEQLKDLGTKSSGLVLFTGPTGSGKSTSLAAMINYINSFRPVHIISVEDPVEYVFTSNKAFIQQRQLGADAFSFEKSISEAMREDPDILIIGEMRDKASIEAALVASETGHLVFSTLHTRSASATVNRLIDMFETDKQNQILSQLSTSLLAVLSQQLLPSVNRDRLYLATEFMMCNNAIKANIKQNKIQMIDNMISIGKREGMYLMKDSVELLYKEGKIAEETFKNLNSIYY